MEYYLLLLLPGILLGLYAQFKLSAAYNRYVREGVSSGVSGAEAAREILDRAGLQDVAVNETPGHLTDHYDPTRRALFLSSENYHGSSVAAVGVAAHEAGHALQHQAAYAPLKLRMALVPITNIATQASIWITGLGYLMGFAKLAIPGIIIYSAITFFQLVTLPVEFDASRRAKAALQRLGIVQGYESGGVSKVLNAAALTYVAAMVSSLMTLLHFILIARNHDRD